MAFIDLNTVAPITPLPGCRMQTPYGENLMLSRVELQEGAVIPLHDHPHEQGGIVLEGQLELTIGDDTRILQAGQMYIIPPNMPHRAAAHNGPAVALDVFSPVREDYAQAANSYIPESE